MSALIASAEIPPGPKVLNSLSSGEITFPISALQLIWTTYSVGGMYGRFTGVGSFSSTKCSLHIFFTGKYVPPICLI